MHTAFIKLNNLSLDLPIIGSTSFRSELISKGVGGFLKKSTSKTVSVQALRNITLDIKEGDSIGLIGHNGAGKSTLLRMLAGAYFPSSGEMIIEGKITPLLSLGAGMDGDFTGYENILNAALYMGFTKKQANELIPDIEEFTELGNFLDLPMRTYSSGMLLRLSFAIATAQMPDILLIDEVFGAGDASFYEKAKKRMEATLKSAKIIVMATHSMALMEQYCTKAAVMDKGEVLFFGSTVEANSFYQDLVKINS